MFVLTFFKINATRFDSICTAVGAKSVQILLGAQVVTFKKSRQTFQKCLSSRRCWGVLSHLCGVGCEC